MSYAKAYGAAQQYAQVGNEASITDANPHTLIKLLLDGALERIAVAKGNLQRGEVGQKCTAISKAITIVEGLRAALDMGKGGDIARNLDELYEYLGQGLMEANLRNDVTKLEEVAKLLSDIRSAWDAIAPTADRATL